MEAKLNFHNFLIEKVGLYPKHVKQYENTLLVEIFQQFKESQDGSFNEHSAREMLFCLCLIHPSMYKEQLRNELYSIITQEFIEKFITIIYYYLDNLLQDKFVLDNLSIKILKKRKI